MVCGPSRKVSGLSSSSAPRSWRSLARVTAGASTLRGLAPSSCRSLTTSTSTCPDATIACTVSSRCARSNLAIRVTRRISSASSRHGPAVIIRTSAASSCGSAIARSACSRSRISGVSNRLSPPTTVYGMSSSRSRATIASRCLCLRYRTATSVHLPPVPSPTIDLMASTMATASSSGAGADEELDRVAVGAVGREALVGLEAGLVVGDEPVGGGQDVAAPSGSSARSGGAAAGRAACALGSCAGGRDEPRVELGERGEAGAPEPVDRLVVVADDHDVVGPVRRPAEQLDQLDLGDVGVLELVDQEVAELALPAAQDVRAGS